MRLPKYIPDLSVHANFRKTESDADLSVCASFRIKTKMSSWWLGYLIVPVLVGVLFTEYKTDLLKLLKTQLLNGRPLHGSVADNVLASISAL